MQLLLRNISINVLKQRPSSIESLSIKMQYPQVIIPKFSACPEHLVTFLQLFPQNKQFGNYLIYS